MASDFSIEEAAVSQVDAWIEKLFECKPLTELEVRQLCDKVSKRKAICYTEMRDVQEISSSLVFIFRIDACMYAVHF